MVLGYVLVDVIAGAPSSPLRPPLPAGARVPGWSAAGARLLGLGGAGGTSLTVLTMVVLAALVALFLCLVREAWKGRLALTLVLVAGALSVALSVAAPLLLSRDVYSYAAYGRLYSLHGANPYVEPPSRVPSDPFTPVLSPEWRDTRSLYGPAFTLVSAGITRTWPGSPGATILAFKVLAGLAVGGATLVAVVLCRRFRPHRASLAAVLVAMNPVIVIHTVGGGHNDLMMMMLVMAALAVALRPDKQMGRSIWPVVATALLTLAALVKLPAAVPLVLWVWSVARAEPASRRLRIVALHAAMVAAVGAALIAPFYVGLRTLKSVAVLASVEGWASGVRLVARGARALGNAVAGGAGATSFDKGVKVAFIAAFAVVLWRLARRSTPSASADEWGTALLAFSLSAALLLPWFVAWFIPLLALMDDDELVWTGTLMTVVLALTGVPAEPSMAPGAWRAMILAVHYGAAPIMLGLTGFALVRAARHDSLSAGATVTSRSAKARA
jgi:alpha-1,6-mannosyltransferase